MKAKAKSPRKYDIGMFVRIDDKGKTLLQKIAEKDQRSESGEIRALIEKRAQELDIEAD
ncbi:hypothetical protein HY230_09300 [Candidatus Acetothermia bacterium]|nr:hypothetical protein [Candidatus Acetothermia bacterium]